MRVSRAPAVNAVVEMRRRAPRVSRIADVAEDVTRLDDISLAKGAEAIEMGVIVPLESGAEDEHHLPAEAIRPHARHQAAGRADDRRALRREDVNSLVPPSVRPCGAPGVNDSRTRRINR